MSSKKFLLSPMLHKWAPDERRFNTFMRLEGSARKDNIRLRAKYDFSVVTFPSDSPAKKWSGYTTKRANFQIRYVST
jgi:hypothetical protein